MSEEKPNVPKLRFPGFADPWEQRKALHLASYSKGKGYSKDDLTESGTPVILYGRLYTKYESVIEEVDTFVDASNDGIYSHGDEVIVPASGETAEDIARASAVAQPGVLLGGDLNILRPNKSITSLFMALSLSNGTAQKELSKRAQGKSVVHVHNSDIQDVTISYPTIDEQTQIGAFFRSLDSLITLHQRKLDHLKEMKKGLLQKMFPKNGESIPELRFPGFADPWEQRKLGEIAEIVGGGTPNTSVEEYWVGDIDWYTPAELGDRRYVDSSLRKITQAGYDNSSARMLPANRTILFTSRAGIGNTAILCSSACTNQGFQSLVVGDSADVDFIYSLSDDIKRKAEIKASGSTFLEISGKRLTEIEVLAPALVEQVQIGSFFRQLDSLIALHQRKLDHLKQMKKGLLQQMFV